MDGLIDIPLWRLALTLALMAALIGLSAWQRFGLERTVLWATLRCAAQLMIIGYVLHFIFDLRRWEVIVLLLGVMASIAGVTGAARLGVPLPHRRLILTGAVIVSTALTLVFGLGLVIQPPHWWEPQFLIPLGGIMLGNAMNSASLGGERLASSIRQSKVEIESRLALGFAPREACHRHRSEAMHASLLPTLNTMFVVGIVTFPGIMTGQMLSGASPLIAAKYQIFIMFTITFSNAIAAWLTNEAVWRMHFNEAWQLREGIGSERATSRS